MLKHARFSPSNAGKERNFEDIWKEIFDPFLDFFFWKDLSGTFRVNRKTFPNSLVIGIVYVILFYCTVHTFKASKFPTM